ncbi:MAG: ABC transporter substrate-binding protein [Defluviitaleaceae bacterium]|nr:ABC transporter substrate-binding protein [Defluviitaleaceae bacterium]
MKRIVGMVIAGTFLFGVLAACTPQAQPTAPDPAVPAQPAQQEPVATPGTAEPEQPPVQGLGRGVIVATQNETPAVAPARHTAVAGSFKNMLTHNGLFRVDHATLEPVPDLVESWRPLSDTVFEFTLREGIMFHNGEEMTAEDVVASIYYVRTFPYAAASHGSVVGADVVDRYTFTLDTGSPNAMLFFDLTLQGNFIMPAALINSGHDFTVEPVGSGPFVFDEWRHGDFLNFVAFDNYFDTERAARVESIHWRIIPEGSSRTIALEAGEVDFIVEVPFPDIPRMEANPDISVVMIPGTAHNFLLLNNDLEMFSNVYVRRAIHMALDKEAMALAGSDGFAIPTWANMPTVFAGSTLEGTRDFDPDGARALLAEHNIDPSTIRFEILASNEEGRRRGEVVQSNLADIGIEVTIAMIDLAGWLTVTASENYEAAFGSFTASNILTFFRSTSHIASIDGPNRSRMRNEELTALIDQAIATIDANERIAILEEASRMANEHVGFIPNHLSMVIRAFNSGLHVPETHATGALNLNMVYWVE